MSAMNCEERSFATKYKRLAQREESHSEDESFENHGSKADKKPEWTTRRKLLLIGVCLVNLVAFGAIALIMPFFPTVVSTVKQKYWSNCSRDARHYIMKTIVIFRRYNYLFIYIASLFSYGPAELQCTALDCLLDSI